MAGKQAALVTGGARRIGAELIRALAGRGHPVAIHCRSSVDEAEGLATSIRSRGGHAAVVQGDLRDEEVAEGLVARAEDALGPLGILVNNASHFGRDTLRSCSRESWDAHMEVNLRAPLVLGRSFAARITVQGGQIVNLLDPRVWNLTPSYLSYTVSRAGLWAATRVLALELAPAVRVNAIGPGPMLSNPVEDETTMNRLRRRLPLSEGPDPADVAGALLYLVDARTVTGQMIAPDGGQHLGWSLPGVPREP